MFVLQCLHLGDPDRALPSHMRVKTPTKERNIKNNFENIVRSKDARSNSSSSFSTQSATRQLPKTRSKKEMKRQKRKNKHADEQVASKVLKPKEIITQQSDMSDVTELAPRRMEVAERDTVEVDDRIAQYLLDNYIKGTYAFRYFQTAFNRPDIQIKQFLYTHYTYIHDTSTTYKFTKYVKVDKKVYFLICVGVM